MEGLERDELSASLGAARQRFLAAVRELRPSLHRFCTRMSGSVLDGEDLVQETLAQAFYSLPSLRDQARLEPWLFRIAHNKCVDFLRREGRRGEEPVPFEEDLVGGPTDDGDGSPDEPVDEALVALVTGLPPMERACVLLKDVLGYKLGEIAEIVDSTLGGVKAALHRGRTKLRTGTLRQAGEFGREQRQLLLAYIDCFNRRDWDGLRRLIQSDARIEVVGVTETTAATYFTNYSALGWEWKFGLARVDGEPLIVVWRKTGDSWIAYTAVKLWWRNGQVVRIRDYVHVDYLLRHGRTIVAG